MKGLFTAEDKNPFFDFSKNNKGHWFIIGTRNTKSLRCLIPNIKLSPPSFFFLLQLCFVFKQMETW